MRTVYILFGILIVLGIIGIAVKGSIDRPVVVTDDLSDSDTSELVAGNNQFAFDMYEEMRQIEKENIFFSPYSISTALAMTYEGARGTTAQEMQRVFHFPSDDDARRKAFATLHRAFNKRRSAYNLSVANALWIQDKFPLTRAYTNTVKTYYKGETQNLDFVNQEGKSRKTINSWVAKKTKDKIKNIIPPGFLSKYTRLVLTNAIYFKGDWIYAFDKDETKDETFYVNGVHETKAPMMFQEENRSFPYTETETVQVIELPYKGEEISMLIILPKDRNGLPALENTISSDDLTIWKDDLTTQKVVLEIPKFTFEQTTSLRKTLEKLGMPTAFNDRADFSGISESGKLAISEVLHKAFVQVDETGTEAAAATAVSVNTTSISLPSPIPIFRADHPFMFLIQDRATGSILFLGRITDPRS